MLLHISTVIASCCFAVVDGAAHSLSHCPYLLPIVSHSGVDGQPMESKDRDRDPHAVF